MAYIITVDHIDSGDAVDKWNANFRNPENGIEKCREICKEPFRMFDDDGELYYEGFSNDSSSFQPLDDFGMPNAGCTDIQYKDTGKWESL